MPRVGPIVTGRTIRYRGRISGDLLGYPKERRGLAYMGISLGSSDLDTHSSSNSLTMPPSSV